MITKTCDKCGVSITRHASQFRGAPHCKTCWADVEKKRLANRLSDQTMLAVKSTWGHMKDRCLNQASSSYGRYGGRGITIFPAWLASFNEFFHDMGPKPTAKHSIGRIDNDGNYEPGNVEWQTSKQQTNNYSRNVVLEHRGLKLNLQQWADRIGIHRVSLMERIKSGLTGDQLFAPKSDRGRKLGRSISFNDETKNMKDWASDLGISSKALRDRLKSWPIARALTEHSNDQYRRTTATVKKAKNKEAPPPLRKDC